MKSGKMNHRAEHCAKDCTDVTTIPRSHTSGNEVGTLTVHTFSREHYLL